jgi:hypothetical protein
VRPTNRLARHLGFGRRQAKGSSDGVGTILRVRWRTDEHSRRLRVAAACGNRSLWAAGRDEDGRHVGLGEPDRQPGFANAGLDARIGVTARKIADSDSRASQIDATIMFVFVSAFD